MAKQVLFGYRVTDAAGNVVLDSGEPHLVSAHEAKAAAFLLVKHSSHTSAASMLDGTVIQRGLDTLLVDVTTADVEL